MLSLSLLGHVELKIDGQTPGRVVTNKAVALLVYLLLTRQPHSRHALAGMLWGEIAENKAKGSLRVALSALRKHLPAHVQADRLTVWMDADAPFWCDLVEWEQLVAAGQSADAIPLLRGEFMADFHVDGAPAFNEWLQTQRAHWQQRTLTVLSDVSQQQIAQRDYKAAVESLRRLLTIEPWQESAHRHLMIALSQQGDFNAALAQYETCRQLLDDELGVPPMAETVALYERIQLARAGRPHNLPAAATGFIGRKAEIARISTLLLDQKCRLVTILGMGGIGKTRLAVATAQHLNQTAPLRFVNGITFVALQAIDATTSAADAIATAVAQALDLFLPGRRSPSAEVAEYLVQEDQLLILDNFEHLLAGAAWLSQLLQRCPQLTLLVTSRELLAIPGEWRFALDGLPYPHSAQAVANPDQFAAIQLFEQSAQQADPSFELTADNRPHIVRLCQLVTGMPLALQLAAAWLRVLSTAEIVAEVERSLDFLAESLRHIPARHHSIRAIFEYAWTTLSEPEQAVFAQLSVFRGGFDRTAAGDVAGASLATLMRFVDKSLLRRDAAGRYELHELLRQFSAEKLHQHAQQLQDTQNAHSRTYADFLHQQMATRLSRGSTQTIAAIDTEIDNIRAAWRWLVAQIQSGTHSAVMIDYLTNFLPPLAWYYRQRVRYVEGQAALQAAESALTAAITMSESSPKLSMQIAVIRAQLQIRLANLCYYTGDYDQAEALIAVALPILREAQLIEEEALALETLAKPTRRRGDYAKTRALAQQSEQLYRQANNQLGMIQVLALIAVTAADEGDYALAEQSGQRVTAYYREINDTANLVMTQSNLANTYMKQGKHAAAKPLLEEAYALAQTDNNRFALMIARSNLALTLQALGNFDQSKTHSLAGLKLAREMGDRRWTASNLNTLSQTESAQQNWQSAERYALDALAINHTIQNEADMLSDLSWLAYAWANQGKIEATIRIVLYVQQHPATTTWNREQATRLHDELRPRLSASVVESAARWAAGQRLGDVVAWVFPLRSPL